nr:hypothetical protein [Tanacetum cinerariifolium]
GISQRVESSDDVENVFNQGRISVDMDQDKRVELVVDQEKDITEGYKMEFFKGKTYDQILPIFQAREEIEKEDEEIIKSTNETPAQKAAKRRKLRCNMEKSKECSWFSIGEKMEAADFMWCTCDYSLNSSALLIG